VRAEWAIDPNDHPWEFREPPDHHHPNESGELERIENERIGLQFDLKENKAVACRGDWLKRTSATINPPIARIPFGKA
jgi:hypothetical protein